jgi:dihydrodipicolinate synthase/N-acetylneuraminate lyase
MCVKENGRDINWEMIARSVEYLHEQGIHGYIVSGGMGQSHAYTDTEWNKLVDVCVDATKGSQAAVIGDMPETTKECLRRARYAEDVGADGVMVHCPKGAPMTLEAAWEHFRIVNDGIDEMQILAYDFPPYRGPRLSPEFWSEKLLSLDRITCLKMAYGDSIYKARMLRRIAHKIHVTADIWNDSALGADSSLSISDVWYAPKILLEYFNGCMEQPDISKRSKRLRKLREAYRTIRGGPAPGAPLAYPHRLAGMGLAYECASLQAMVNFTTAWTGINAGPVRKPYPSFTADQMKARHQGARRYVETMKAFGDTHKGEQPILEITA